MPGLSLASNSTGLVCEQNDPARRLLGWLLFGARGGRLVGVIGVPPRQGQGPLIDDAALLAGRARNGFDSVLEGRSREGAPEHAVNIDCLSRFALRWGPDDDDELAARLRPVPIGKRERRNFAAPDLFM